MIARRFTHYGSTILIAAFAFGIVCSVMTDSAAQEAADKANPAAEKPADKKVKKKKAVKKDPSSEQQSQFAPGIVTVIPPSPDPKETVDGPLTFQELLDMHPEIKLDTDPHPGGEPHFDPRSRTLRAMAMQARLHREIYCFEFSFKPLRHIYLDVPGTDGRMQRKLIWYMVYRVRYRGGDLRPATDRVAGVDIPRRVEAIHYDARYCFPMLKLVDHSDGREYTDRILPSTTNRIKVREKITTKLYNSERMGRVKIPYSTDKSAPGVWGVATWEDVDPRTDFASVEVYGLTNAFQQDGEGENAPYRRKALQLNFYRPGDAVNQVDDKIRFGVPAYQDKKQQDYILKQYKLTERLDYRWLFR